MCETGRHGCAPPARRAGGRRRRATSGSRFPTSRSRTARDDRPLDHDHRDADIFRGIRLDPLAPANSFYLLWMILGYMVVSSVLIVGLGRLGDIFGRVRIYNSALSSTRSRR